MNLLKRLSSRFIFWIAAIVLLSIPAVLPLTKQGFFPTQDFIHVARIYEMDKVLKDGQFPARWVPDFRYGEPLFNFYAPLPFYLGSLIHNLGFGFLDTTKILFALSFILSGVTMFLLAREFFGKMGGLLSAILYIYAPYHSVDIYVRGAMSESLALVFFPLIFLASLRLSQKNNLQNIAFLALSLGGLFLTHNIMTVLFTPFFLGWIGFLIWREGKLQLVKYFLPALLLGIALASTFLLPAFFEKDLVQSSKMITGYFDYRGHFVEIKQFFSTFWGYGASLWLGNDDMSFQVGLTHWAVLTLSVMAAIVSRKNRKQLLLIGFLIASFLFSLFMQHNKSTPIWTNFPILAYTQFPWRFLGISIFFISLISGILGIYMQKKFAFLALVVIAAVVWGNINYFKPESYYLDSVDTHYVGPEVLTNGDKLPKDYLPVWVEDLQRERITLPHPVNGEAVASNYENKSTSAQFRVSVTKEADIEVPLTYFPGWEVKANGRQVKIEDPDKYGLVRFKLTPGDYDVKLSLLDTPVRKAGNALSLITAVIIIALLSSRKLKPKLWFS